jgi:uncharacterized cupredoxin-like copper-binding protein
MDLEARLKPTILAAVTSLLWISAASAHEAAPAGHGAHATQVVTFAAGEPGTAGKPSRRIEVVAREADGRMLFAPDRVTVAQGEQIEFIVRNEGQLDHEFVLGSPAENAAHARQMASMPDMQHVDPNAARVAVGQDAHLVWRFTKAGTFEFACLVPGHYEAGMKGQASVQAR